MCLTGQIVDADEAVKIGLVQRIASAGHLVDDAIAVARAAVPV